MGKLQDLPMPALHESCSGNHKYGISEVESTQLLPLLRQSCSLILMHYTFFKVKQIQIRFSFPSITSFPFSN